MYTRIQTDQSTPFLLRTGSQNECFRWDETYCGKQMSQKQFFHSVGLCRVIPSILTVPSHLKLLPIRSKRLIKEIYWKRGGSNKS